MVSKLTLETNCSYNDNELLQFTRLSEFISESFLMSQPSNGKINILLSVLILILLMVCKLVKDIDDLT